MFDVHSFLIRFDRLFVWPAAALTPEHSYETSILTSKQGLRILLVVVLVLDTDRLKSFEDEHEHEDEDEDEDETASESIGN